MKERLSLIKAETKNGGLENRKRKEGISKKRWNGRKEERRYVETEEEK